MGVIATNAAMTIISTNVAIFFQKSEKKKILCFINKTKRPRVGVGYGSRWRACTVTGECENDNHKCIGLYIRQSLLILSAYLMVWSNSFTLSLSFRWLLEEGSSNKLSCTETKKSGKRSFVLSTKQTRDFSWLILLINCFRLNCVIRCGFSFCKRQNLALCKHVKISLF